MKKITTEEFISKAVLKHGDRYNYSLVAYSTTHAKVKIICPDHGVFQQSPNNHLKGQGCRKCGSIKHGKSLSKLHKNNKQDFSHIVPPEGSKVVPLTQGQYALVDEEDYERVMQHNWCTVKGDSTYYAENIVLGRMHRFIMGVTDKDIFLDHKNNCGLDNRKTNLRKATKQQNSFNVKKRKGLNRYKGVTAIPRGKFKARITLCYHNYHIGYFDTEEEAARAYDMKAKELFGEFAWLNFPEEVTNG